MAGRLDRLLRPQSIAVFGGRPAAAVVAQCEKMGFAGPIWPVHPDKDSIGGRPCFRSVAALPAAPDAAFIGVNRALTIEIVRALAARGAGGAVCYAAGFREAQDEAGERLDEALLAAAGDMPILGPNCYGAINYLDGALLWPDQHGGERLGTGTQGVAIITQSSNIALNMTMQARALPIAYMVTAGNQAQTGLSEIAAGLLDDPRVTVLGLHIEGFDDVRAFEAMTLKARALGKPVVAIKLGRSAEARSATLSHTASLTGSEAGAEALFDRLGVARLSSIPAFLETLKLLHVHGPLGGLDIASMSCSGGEASLMADAAVGTRLRYRALGAEQRARLKAKLGPLVAIANPLDYHTFIWGDEAALTETFTAMLSGGFDLSMLVLDLPRRDRCDAADWTPAIEAFQTALHRTRAKGAVVATMGENMPETRAQQLMDRSIVPLCGIEEAMAAAEAAASIGAAWRRPAAPPIALVPRSDKPPILLDEAEAKRRLAGAGVPVPPGHRCETATEAADAAELLGYPVALKGTGVAHKTEAGALRLGLRTRAAVLDAAFTLGGTGRPLLVERMVPEVVAELVVGITRDEGQGLLLTVGAGGIWIELLQDAVTLLLPTDEAELRRALGALRMAPLLTGYRGGSPADLEAAIRAILTITEFALAQGAALEVLEVNPLMVCAEGAGAFAADALLRLRE